MRLHPFFGLLVTASLAFYGFAEEPRPKADPVTTVDRDHAVKIALAHLNIDKVTKEPSAAFNLRVSQSKTTRKEVEELAASLPAHFTKHKDLAGLPESFEAFTVTVQHGLSGDTCVLVTKKGGRVILVQFLPEG